MDDFVCPHFSIEHNFFFAGFQIPLKNNVLRTHKFVFTNYNG